MDRPYFWEIVKNSLIIVFVAVALSIVLAFLAAVALAKFRFTGRKLFIVADDRDPDAAAGRADHPALRRAREVPPDERADRRDPHVHDVRRCPFAVWTLRGFILGIPKELEEAAMVDGSSRLGAFVRILLPLVAPGLVATSVFVFITSWNEYIFANVLLTDQSKQTRHRLALVLLRHEPEHRLGRADGRLDADRDPRRRSSSCSCSAGSRSG